MVALAVCGLAVTLTGIACSAQSSGPRGRYEDKRLNAGGEVYHYTVYVPWNHRPGSAVPLVVVLHGCTTTADEMAAASGYGLVADQRRFIVVYPDVSSADEARGRCWRAIWDPHAEGRGRGDAGAIASMTRAVIAHWRIDRTRVYVIGISAGAFETAILGAAYPDLYAAIGIHSGAAYMGGAQGCLVDGESPAGVNTLARSAFTVMGTHAHLMPVIAFHGDKDGTIPYRCGRQALAQWLRTDDLILEHERRVPLPAAPTGGSHAVVPDGHAYTVDSFEDLSGCPVAQFWTIHGMGHYWSGGSADPASARYTDPRGPSAASDSWAFFSRWRLSGAVESCTHPGR